LAASPRPLWTGIRGCLCLVCFILLQRSPEPLRHRSERDRLRPKPAKTVKRFVTWSTEFGTIDRMLRGSSDWISIQRHFRARGRAPIGIKLTNKSYGLQEGSVGGLSHSPIYPSRLRRIWLADLSFAYGSQERFGQLAEGS
jgi:hypothetical protein